MKVLCVNTPRFEDEVMESFKKDGIDIQRINVENVDQATIDKEAIDMIIGTSYVSKINPMEFRNLRAVQLSSAGFDMIDLAQLKQRGISVSNASGIYSIPIAEWVVGKVLEVYKDSRTLYQHLEKKQWVKSREMQELSDKKAIVFGTGGIGLEIANRLNPFVVKVDGVNSNGRHVDVFYQCYSLDSVYSVLKNYDIIIFALPSNSATIRYVNSTFLSKCKESAVLVNVGRGTLIDEGALIDSLNEGKFFSVVLDVTQKEPLPSDSELYGFQRVIISPHNSFGSHKISQRLKELFVENIYRSYRKEPLINQL